MGLSPGASNSFMDGFMLLSLAPFGKRHLIGKMTNGQVGGFVSKLTFLSFYVSLFIKAVNSDLSLHVTAAGLTKMRKSRQIRKYFRAP